MAKVTMAKVARVEIYERYKSDIRDNKFVCPPCNLLTLKALATYPTQWTNTFFNSLIFQLK